MREGWQNRTSSPDRARKKETDWCSTNQSLFSERETGIEPVPVGEELKWLKILPQCHGFAL
nr:MAG TPA: hypothetical protein [Inoviridae sp.]